MVFSNVIVDVTISCHLFVFGQSCAKVCASFTMWVAWQLQHFILFTASCLSSGLSLSLTLVSSSCKVVIALCATEVPMMYGIVAVVTGP